MTRKERVVESSQSESSGEQDSISESSSQPDQNHKQKHAVLNYASSGSEEMDESEEINQNLVAKKQIGHSKGKAIESDDDSELIDDSVEEYDDEESMEMDGE